MNKIILILLFNILIYHLYNKNKYLLIPILVFMIYYIYNMSKTVEGNFDSEKYKYEFAKSLNSNVKKNRKKDYIYDSIIDKLNKFLKDYIHYEKIPDNQPCMGIFDSWSKCNVDCGTGEQTRTFTKLQYSGKDGIKCIFEDGEIDSKTCFEGKCHHGDICTEDKDCVTSYCSPYSNKCSNINECSVYELFNCDFDECNDLGINYHNDKDGNCIDYIEREKTIDIRKGYNVEVNGKKKKMIMGQLGIKLISGINVEGSYPYDSIKYVVNETGGLIMVYKDKEKTTKLKEINLLEKIDEIKNIIDENKTT